MRGCTRMASDVARAWARWLASRGPLAVLAVSAALGAAGCGDDQDPEGAKELWDRIHEESYRTWKRAPGYETRRDSSAPHGGASEIFVNGVVDAAIQGQPLSAWPLKSLIVKDGYSGDEHVLVAVMEKRESGWYWAEWDADSEGSATYSGNPAICTDCHQSGSDFVRAFSLPK